MRDNPYDVERTTKRLLIYSIVCYVILFGGLLLSYLFWKNFVNDQFGLFIAFTFLAFVFINIVFKLPAILDIILLSNSLSQMGKEYKDFGEKSRKITNILLVTMICSIILCIVVEVMMFLSTRGSNLG